MEWPDVAPEPTPRTTERESATESEVEARLAAVEELLVAMARRIDGLESTVRVAVAQEVGAVSEDLRHTVSELGRLFVRDVGRLARVLDHHREEIIAELRPPPARASESARAPEPEPEPDHRLAGPGDYPGSDLGSDLGSDGPGTDDQRDQRDQGDDLGDERRRRRLGRRGRGA